GYDNGAKLNGKKPIRGARQKGAQVTMSGFDLSGKLTYYGIKGLDLGIAGYFGNTESSLYDNLHSDSISQIATADSSSIGVNMIGVDFRYQKKNFETRGELILANLDNTDQYNAFTGEDLGETSLGYYFEVGYNVASALKMKKKLVPFVRYSNYNTHQATNAALVANPSYQKEIITTGLTYFLNDNFVAKADYQQGVDGNDAMNKTVNFGIGYWFR
ncbi:MAG: hypothetical protein ACPGYY_05455, partial [Bacteroidia bacterium]